METYQGKRVLIIGAARQGLALARFLSSRGALVTLNDKQTAEQLQSALQQISDSSVTLVLGGHPLSLLDATDLVCVSGGVPLNLPLVAEAIHRGIPVTNDSQVFMENLKAPNVGITGSAGKTTTTTLLGRMATHQFRLPRRAWVGGNIGYPLLEYVEEIDSQDLVIQELSSFQLDLMTISPNYAAVLNITPNHLDRHADMAAYIEAKSHILAFQKEDDVAVLNREDTISCSLQKLVRGRLVTFGKESDDSANPQVFVSNGKVIFEDSGQQTELLDTGLIRLPGVHNLMNVLAACALAAVLKFDAASITAGVEGFQGVEHRQQLVRVVNGISWVNDSIATAPERTLASLHSYTEPIVLLLGGRDKNLPWDVLAAEIHRRVDHVVLFGEAADKIAAAIGKPAAGDQLQSVALRSSLAEALDETLHIAEPGDVVLLSPGCTSYDAFKDFEERGRFFTNWVNAL